jgi:hypothetical protein
LIIQTRKTFESQHAHKNLAHIIAARTYSATTTKSGKKKTITTTNERISTRKKKTRAGKRRKKKTLTRLQSGYSYVQI